MTGTKQNSNDLDPRRRRMIFRAWHRGIREMDLIFGQYVDAHIHQFTDEQLDEMERLMEIDDRDLLPWVTGELPVPVEVDTPLFRDMLDYRKHIDFV